MDRKRNLSLLTDFYELTMSQGWFYGGGADKVAVFDLFYRNNPHEGGFAVFAGLEQIIEFVRDMRFGDEEISYLKGLNMFDDAFLTSLRDFRFNGDICAMPEGSVVFPMEPLVRVKARIAEAQLLETALLNIINHQSLIATKAARIVHSADGGAVMEFGARRAQGPDAATLGARAAYIAGCAGTSNTACGLEFGVPVKGTMAHSWVMSFDNEFDAFMAYANQYPSACVLLVDTYDTLKSGCPNAIKVFEHMRRNGNNANVGIRLDSGDLAYLSKRARKMLDDAGFPNATITASGDLDETLITSLKQQGAKIDAWGVGTRLITSEGFPSFGGVYKLCATEDGGGVVVPKIKLSDNAEKITNPGLKRVVRLYDKENGKIKADLIALDDEIVDETADLTLTHPLETWKKMTLKGGTYTKRDMLVPVFESGACVYESPAIEDIRAYHIGELGSLWDEHKRLVNPHIVPVDLSDRLRTLRADLYEGARM